jgi:DNA ligase-1
LDITQEGWNRRSSESAALAEVIDIDVEPEESGPPRGAQVLSSGPHWLSYTSQSGEASFSGRALAADNHVPPASDATGPPPYRLLSQETFTFDLEDQAWPSGVAAPYSFLAHTLAHLAKTRSRAAIINILTNSLRTIIRFHTSSLLPTLYLLSNSLSPAYRSVELGLGPSSISRAIQHVSGISSQALKRLYISAGDPGDVAFEAKSDLRTLVPHNPLIVDAVYASLLNIAQLRGPGATKQKQAIAEKLLVAAKGEEVRYLVRTLCQNLRVGAVRTSILIALARAMVLTPPPDMTIALPKDSPYYVGVGLLSQAVKSPSTRDELYLRFSRAETLIREVYVQHPNYDDIVKALLEAGLDGLRERVPLTIGECRSSFRFPHPDEFLRNPLAPYAGFTSALFE